MGRFVVGADRSQMTFLPECLDDWVGEDNPVQVIEAFIEALDLLALGFEGALAKATGRPSHHPAVLLKLGHGYLNRVQSSRRLEREAGRNVELMWLLGRFVLDHTTIADFRKENGAALRKVCAVRGTVPTVAAYRLVERRSQRSRHPAEGIGPRRECHNRIS
jgi:transposase